MSINTNVRMPSKSILIPMIRNIMPTLMANQITGVQPMTGHAGQIFSTDKTYVGGYNFNLKYWPHVTMVTWQHVLDAERWCYKNFKSRNWRNSGQFFAFKREQDFLLFTLKWS